MSNDRFWYGYLDAGDRSSPVLRDNTLDTHNPETVYLFNLKRKEIIEYKREIVEARLKPLEDESVIDDLTAAYMVASRDFVPRRKKMRLVSDNPSPTPSPKMPPSKTEALLEDLSEPGPVIADPDDPWAVGEE